MKKLFAILPIMGLIAGAIVIATEIRTPMFLEQTHSVPVPQCQKTLSKTNINLASSPHEDFVICSR